MDQAQGRSFNVGTERSTPATNQGKNREFHSNRKPRGGVLMGDQNGAAHLGNPIRLDLQLDAILPLFDETLQKRILHSIQIIETAFMRYG